MISEDTFYWKWKELEGEDILVEHPFKVHHGVSLTTSQEQYVNTEETFTLEKIMSSWIWKRGSKVLRF